VLEARPLIIPNVNFIKRVRSSNSEERVSIFEATVALMLSSWAVKITGMVRRDEDQSPYLSKHYLFMQSIFEVLEKYNMVLQDTLVSKAIGCLDATNFVVFKTLFFQNYILFWIFRNSTFDFF
jgi:hypothetical protein